MRPRARFRYCPSGGVFALPIGLFLAACGDPDPKCADPVEADEGSLVGDAPCEPVVVFDDVDGDGLGDPLTGRWVCEVAEGQVPDATDCDPVAFVDTDGDETQDCADPDADGDGLRNEWDAAPLDPTVVRGPLGGRELTRDLVISGDTEVPPAIPLAAPITGGDAELTLVAPGAFQPGDEVLVYAQQGPGAGRRAFATVSAVDGPVLTVEPAFTVAFDPVANRVAVQAVPHFRQVLIQSGGSLRARPWNGQTGGVVAFRASGAVTIVGDLIADGAGFAGGAGATCVLTAEDVPETPEDERACDVLEATSGESVLEAGEVAGFVENDGGGGAAPSAEDLANAGAGAAFATGGTCGGSIDGDCASLGGKPYGDRELLSWYLGSGGGGGGADTDGNRFDPDDVGGAGGAGGGLIAVWSSGPVTVTGKVSANGLDGGPGAAENAFAGAGGGGSGGTISVVAPTVDVAGRVSAIGGQGGDFVTIGVAWAPAAGGDGGVGRVRFDTEAGVTLVGDGVIVPDDIFSGVYTADPPPLSFPPLPDPVIDPTPPVVEDGDENPIVTVECAGDYLQGGLGCAYAGGGAGWGLMLFGAAALRRGRR
jgi:hypothetical protein